jgi:hypothetical protein
MERYYDKLEWRALQIEVLRRFLWVLEGADQYAV